MVDVVPSMVIGSAPPTVRVLAVNVIPALSTSKPPVPVKTTRPLVNPLAFSVCALTCVADKLPEVLNCAAFMVDADTLPVVCMNPLELTAASVVVPVAFNAPVLTMAALTFAVVLINPVASKVVALTL